MAEKLITLAKQNTLFSRRQVISKLNDRRLVDEKQDLTGQTVVQKLFSEIAPKMADRRGGYTRIIKLAKYRIGDAGSIVILQLVQEENKPTGTIRKAAGLRRKRTEKKRLFAIKAEKGAASKAEASEAVEKPKAE